MDPVGGKPVFDAGISDLRTSERWPTLLLLEQAFQIIVEPRHTLGVAVLVRSARLRGGLFGYLVDVVAQNGNPIGEFRTVN